MVRGRLSLVNSGIVGWWISYDNLIVFLMTRWDEIYKDFMNGGEAWATLGEDIDERFVKLVEKSDFQIKKVLDIGCGTGKYLKFLEDKGFTVEGVDNSPTAVKVSSDNLGSDAKIRCCDMYELDLPPEEYDLILSVSTIHHGFKNAIERLVEKIYDALTSGGKVFITFPDFGSAQKWNTFKDKEKLAAGTYAPLSGPEMGLAHSFYTKSEVEELFSKFSSIKIHLDDIGRLVVVGNK